MKEMKHTPGPWEWVDGDNDEVWDGSCYVRHGSLRSVSKNDSGFGFVLPAFIIQDAELADDATSLANARLIAAAPELLEALVDIEAAATEASVPNKAARILSAAIHRARSAIAKATHP